MNPHPTAMVALLVGIDQYASPTIRDLGGCVNDVDTMAQLLRDKFNVPPANIKKLINREATHQAIKQAFRQHLIGQAQAWVQAGRPEPAPAFLFHYSGHGSQALDESGLEPDGLDETLVPHDSRLNDVYDIKDWELGQLIDELAAPFRVSPTARPGRPAPGGAQVLAAETRPGSPPAAASRTCGRNPASGRPALGPRAASPQPAVGSLAPTMSCWPAAATARRPMNISPLKARPATTSTGL